MQGVLSLDQLALGLHRRLVRRDRLGVHRDHAGHGLERVREANDLGTRSLHLGIGDCPNVEGVKVGEELLDYFGVSLVDDDRCLGLARRRRAVVDPIPAPATERATAEGATAAGAAEQTREQIGPAVGCAARACSAPGARAPRRRSAHARPR